MSWFTNEQQLREWSGPEARFPFDLETFREDSKFDSIASFVMSADGRDMMAFGQCYDRLGRCHLSRLAVAPDQRGKGLITVLMSLLCDYGRAIFSADSSSLFVLTENHPAIHAYTRFGFKVADYPGVMPLENCLYMIK